MNPWTLRFDSKHLERQYMIEFIEGHIKISRFCLGILTVLLMFWTVIETIMLDPAIEYTMVRATSSIIFVILALYTWTSSYKTNYA